jgi:hypothetical protein
MLGNIEGDDQYFRGDLCPYIFVMMLVPMSTHIVLIGLIATML